MFSSMFSKYRLVIKQTEENSEIDSQSLPLDFYHRLSQFSDGKDAIELHSC